MITTLSVFCFMTYSLGPLNVHLLCGVCEFNVSRLNTLKILGQMIVIQKNFCKKKLQRSCKVPKLDDLRQNTKHFRSISSYIFSTNFSIASKLNNDCRVMTTCKMLRSFEQSFRELWCGHLSIDLKLSETDIPQTFVRSCDTP